MHPAVAELKLFLGSAGYPLGPSPSLLKHALWKMLAAGNEMEG